MDFLATPYLWELYDNPNQAVSRVEGNIRVGAAIARSVTALVGAIAIVSVSPAIEARIFPDAGVAYIATPPGYNLNIRSGPGTEFPAVNTLRRGTSITITGNYRNGWAQLTNGSWVAGNLISSNPVGGGGGGSGGTYQTRPSTAVISSPGGGNVNLRTGPGTQYPVVNTLTPGTAINITGFYENGWAQLTNLTWVASDLIRVGGPVNPPQQEVFFQVGSRDPLVRDIEFRLRDLGYVTSNFVPDEYFGTDTSQAIRNFQQRNGLPVDGIAGPRTRDVLFSSGAIPNRGTPDGGGTRPPIDPENPVDPSPPDGATRATVSTDDGLDALIFSGPGTEYDLLGFVANGETVSLTGRTSGNWSELQEDGWIYTDFLRF